MNDNITHMLTRKTLSLDQLEQFDSNGTPGPGVTPEIALREVKRLSLLVKEQKTKIFYLRKMINE